MVLISGGECNGNSAKMWFKGWVSKLGDLGTYLIDCLKVEVWLVVELARGVDEVAARLTRDDIAKRKRRRGAGVFQGEGKRCGSFLNGS